MSNLNIIREIDGKIENLNLLIETLSLETNQGTGELSSLIQLNYSQINSPTDSAVASECRGLILDLDTLDVVARTFKRFFNVGQPEAAILDWNTARVQEKKDGSLAILFYYKKMWLFATRGSVGASGQCNQNEFTFNQLIQKTWTDNQYQIDLDPNYTYLFELTSVFNKIVVHYPTPELTLLAIVNKETGDELDIRDIATNIPKIKHYGYENLDELNKTLETMSPNVQEGYVVVDHLFNRLKVKSPRYVLAHKLRDKVTPRGILDLIRTNEAGEFCAYFPEYKPDVHEMEFRLNEIVINLNNDYLMIKHISNRKEFALIAIKSACPGALFSLKDGRVQTVREHLLHGMHEDRLLELMGY